MRPGIELEKRDELLIYIKRNLESILFLASSFLQHESRIKQKQFLKKIDKWTQTYIYIHSDSSWFSILGIVPNFWAFLISALAKLSHKPTKLSAPSPAVSKIVGDCGVKLWGSTVLYGSFLRGLRG